MDVFGYTPAESGNGYVILKNGEHFLQCTGTRAATENIVRILNEEGKHDESKA